MLIKESVFIAAEIFLTYKMVYFFREASRSSLFKKIWFWYFILIIHDFCWFGLVAYKASYRLWVSDTPQPAYLFLAQLVFLVWPLVIFLQVHCYERLLDAHWKPQMRHYILGTFTLGLVGYFGYCFFIRESISTTPWRYYDPFCNLLARSFIMVLKSTTLIWGIQKILIAPSVPTIVRQQAKLIFGLIFLPAILTQPVWILQKYGVLPQNDIAFECFTFFITIYVMGSAYYAAFKLFSLRLFNACSAVQEFFPKSFSSNLSAITHQIRQSTSLQDLSFHTKTFFDKAFGIDGSSVTLYIRPTNHERNLEAARAVKTLEVVEEMYSDKSGAGNSLSAQIQQRRFVLRAEVEYDELYNDDKDAQALRAFMEEINAEAFLPIYGEENLVGYIVIAHTIKSDKLITANEVDSMLTYVDHISHVIEQKQQMSPKILEKESAAHAHDALQYLRERELCFEGMRTMMRAETTEAASMIFMKERCLRVASAEGAKLLGLPEKTNIITSNTFVQPIKQLMCDFKRFKKERSIVLHDPCGNPLRLSVMRDTKQSNAVVLATRPAVSELFNFPSFPSMRDCSNWGYAVFLLTTASGKAIQNFIPATYGVLFDFKIKLLQAILRRRPILLQGAEDDIQSLIQIIHEICAHAQYQKISPKEPEQQQEIYAQIFGAPALTEGQGVTGALADLGASGTLFIEDVDLLSLATQETLAEFMSTGFYTVHVPNKRLNSSNALIICSSQVDLKELVELKGFSAELYNELTKNYLVIPALTSLAEDQLTDLIKSIFRQAGAEENSTGEITTGKLPASLCKLRQRVQEYLKSKQPDKKIVAIPLVDLTNPNSMLEHARRLGKAALKDKQLMSALYDHFKSCAQIAEHLEVDRATVFRWCKKHQIGEYAPGALQKPGPA